MSVVENDDIQWIISLLMSEDLAELEVNVGDQGITVRRDVATSALLSAPAGAAEQPVDEGESEGLVPVLAPMAGAFYRSSAPDVPFFVEVPDDVQEGETVALIEAMKLYNDVEAPCGGRIERILVEDASRVAADQQLMLIRPLA